MPNILLGKIVKLNVSSDPFCIKMFPDVISGVVVRQKLEFTILSEHDDDFVGVGQISRLF